MKKIFGKADEMEKHIQLKSLRWAWAYSTIFLFIWSVYELYLVNEGVNFLLWNFNEVGNLLPIILLFSQGLICIFSQLIYRSMLNSGGKDKEDKELHTQKTSFLARLSRYNDMVTPTVINVVMVIVAIIILVRFLMGR